MDTQINTNVKEYPIYKEEIIFGDWETQMRRSTDKVFEDEYVYLVERYDMEGQFTVRTSTIEGMAVMEAKVLFVQFKDSEIENCYGDKSLLEYILSTEGFRVVRCKKDVDLSLNDGTKVVIWDSMKDSL